MKDVKSTSTFIRALNESLESGALRSQLYNGELNKYIMNLTNNFCQKQLELGVPKGSYVKQAAECLGQQPGSQVWVLNKDVQLNNNGEFIPNEASKFIWLGAIISTKSLANVAPASDAAKVPMKNKPLEVYTS